MKRKLLAMLVCVALVSTLFPFAAMAEETQVRYVAIGDSISSGYGLEVPETEAFPSLIAQDNGYTLTNLAEAGETSGSLLAKLENAEMAEALSTADVITLTIGGNDMLAALFDYLAETTGGQMTAQEILMLFMGQGENADLTTLAPFLQSMTAFPQSEQATQALTCFAKICQPVGKDQGTESRRHACCGDAVQPLQPSRWHSAWRCSHWYHQRI